MNLQQSINQTFSIAGFLFQQSEYAKEIHAKKVEETQIAKDIEEYEKMADYGENPTDEATAAVQTAIAEKGAAAYKRQFYMNPTKKTYKRYMAAEADYITLSTNPINAYAVDKEWFSTNPVENKGNDRATAAQKAEEDRLAATQLETKRLSTLSDWPARIASRHKEDEN